MSVLLLGKCANVVRSKQMRVAPNPNRGPVRRMSSRHPGVDDKSRSITQDVRDIRSPASAHSPYRPSKTRESQENLHRGATLWAPMASTSFQLKEKWRCSSSSMAWKSIRLHAVPSMASLPGAQGTSTASTLKKSCHLCTHHQT